MRLILVLGLSLFSFGAVGAPEKLGWMGIQGGMSVPSYNGTTSRIVYGLSGGAKIGSEFGVGGYYLTNSKDESISNSTVKVGMDLYGVEAGYHFEGEAAGVIIGGRLGMSKVSVGTVSTTPTHFGPFIGMDKSLGTFSIGGEISYLLVGEGSGTAKTDAFNLLNFVATAKLWF